MWVLISDALLLPHTGEFVVPLQKITNPQGLTGVCVCVCVCACVCVCEGEVTVGIDRCIKCMVIKIYRVECAVLCIIVLFS